MTPLPATTPVTVTLEAQQWNSVLGALNEAPHRIARPLIDAIFTQVQANAEAPSAKPNGGAEAHVSN